MLFLYGMLTGFVVGPFAWEGIKYLYRKFKERLAKK